MKPRTKRTLWVSTALFIALCGLAWPGYVLFCPYSPQNRAAALDCTHRWGRLAPFPASARNLTHSITGNPFTRGFRISFTAPAADIEQWLQQSPGPRETTPERPSPGVRHFQIKPGGGAQFAEVTVDDTTHRVSIRVWWS